MRWRRCGRATRAKGKLKDKPPKLSPTQRALLLNLHKAGEHTIPELAELFSVSRATVYRTRTITPRHSASVTMTADLRTRPTTSTQVTI